MFALTPFSRLRLRPQLRQGAASAVLGGLLLVLPGCPDPSETYDRFIDATAEARDELANQEGAGGGELVDISGTHLFFLSTFLSRELPIQFIADVDMEITADGLAGTADIILTPLTLDPGATETPRTQLDETIAMEGLMFDNVGEFVYMFPETVSVTGEANPITGSPIEADLGLDGVIRSTDLWCGSVFGDVLSPIQNDLTGSFFAAVRIEGTSPEELPVAADFPDGQFPLECPALEGAGGSGSGG